MNRKRLGVLAILLASAMLFSGCDAYLAEIAGKLGYYDTVAFADMQYTRPDMAQLEQTLLSSCDVAANAESFDAVVEAIYAYYDVYDRFYTNYHLADIYYSMNMTDIYWEQEYHFCTQNTATADAGLEDLYRALAASPWRSELETEDNFGEGFFDAYEGESLWDETFLEMMEQEAQLQNRYYELTNQAMQTEYGSEEYYSTYGVQMAELYVELVALRQKLADHVGYDSYPQFAYDFFHYRDFTPEQAEAYAVQIGKALVPLYRQVNSSQNWDLLSEYCDEAQTFRHVKTTAESMGGTAAEAFSLLEQAKLYDIAYGENKYTTSFEVFLPSYYEPFVFVNPSLTPADQLTFAHEFGHFAADYVSGGSLAGTDVMEVQSQAMEYMSLCYGQDTQMLTQYKLADSLCIYVEQVAYALFEQRVYDLTGEDLTTENVQELYEQVGSDFGFDSWAWDSRDYVTITHLYMSPMYLISYVVSNDLALQIYQQELESRGAGLETYQQCLSSSESYLLSFAENCGLESPFAPGRLEAVEALFRQKLSQ